MGNSRRYAIARLAAAIALVGAVIGVVLSYRSGPFWLTSLLFCVTPLLAACAIYLRPPRQTRLALYRAAIARRRSRR
ncbi:MAG: hypothetical protein P1U38_10490 [Aeromicrobium sp.]|uniref:hypothetical protein n=1 Tax=Aeromicrobium sp. TaxID=1871063 RepID=UPI0025BC8C8B|nr:hypothetical protein [Aeromicrobium sp.]MCK5890997.1 hypothetical protein [Aeromicrobium sp.]MDF1705191.1 hypothetical protein [Aeromicrobium sp.]